MHKDKSTYDCIVVGGGAAGFFAAINLAELAPGSRILLLEKSNKLLSKVKISGGGRCNLSHACYEAAALAKNYPRGERFLKKAFRHFSTRETVQWFEQRGVKVKTEEDGRMFPISNSSQSIIDCFLSLCQRHRIEIRQGEALLDFYPKDSGFSVKTSASEAISCRFLLLAMGGGNKSAYYQIATGHELELVDPVPSLFTFNCPQSKTRSLAGIAVPHAIVRLAGFNHTVQAPVLITHWGYSGPAVLRLSAFLARDLQAVQYQAVLLINWSGLASEDEVRQELLKFKEQYPKRRIHGHPLFKLPQRLWLHLVHQAGIDEAQQWMDLPKKSLNRLVQQLYAFEEAVRGKTTFKEEFVTAGGISLKEIEHNSLQSKKLPGLYLAGEFLDIDGVTGGFNFQAAWTTAMLAARHMASELQKD